MVWDKAVINPRDLPLNIKQDLIMSVCPVDKEYEDLTDEELEAIYKQLGTMRPYDVLDAWLKFNGIIGYTYRIRDIIDTLRVHA